MTTPLRRAFGGSDRPHHMAMATALSMPLAAMAYHNPGLEVIGHWLQMPHAGLWLVASVACVLHEHWSTADRDMEENRRGWWGHIYWLPYGIAIGHRSVWSHGLVVGTVGRLVYGWWFWLPVLWWYWPWMAIAWCVGAFIADIGHWLLDL